MTLLAPLVLPLLVKDEACRLSATPVASLALGDGAELLRVVLDAPLVDVDAADGETDGLSPPVGTPAAGSAGAGAAGATWLNTADALPFGAGAAAFSFSIAAADIEPVLPCGVRASGSKLAPRSSPAAAASSSSCRSARPSCIEFSGTRISAKAKKAEEQKDGRKVRVKIRAQQGEGRRSEVICQCIAHEWLSSNEQEQHRHQTISEYTGEHSTDEQQ